jgi:twitching motility protein PilT
VLIANGPVAEAIGDPDGSARLDPLIAEGEFWGMQTFDQSLAGLYGRGLVTRADALASATYEPGLSVMLDAADRERAGQPISTEPWPTEALPTEPSPAGPVSVGESAR